MLVGAAVLPTAPLLIPGVTAVLPEGVGAVADAVRAACQGLPAPDLAVLVAPAGEAPHGLYTFDEVDFTAIGRPDLRVATRIDRTATEAISRTIQYSLHHGDRPPLGLAVLAALVGEVPLVAVAVPSQADFDALVSVGTGIAEALIESPAKAVAYVAGDLSAALEDRSPRAKVAGAAEWDERAVAIVDSGRLDGLRLLGPDEAQRVHATGWPALSVLHGLCARAKLGMAARQYSAPRGVGYLVAAGR